MEVPELSPLLPLLLDPKSELEPELAPSEPLAMVTFWKGWEARKADTSAIPAL